MGAYPNIYPYITLRLQDTLAEIDVAGGALDFEIASVIRKCLQGYDQTYNTVTGEDLLNLNEAVGLYVCARIITPLSTGGLNFDVTSEKLPTVERQFAKMGDPDADGNVGEKARWEREANACLALISFVQSSAPGLTTFATASPKPRRINVWGTGQY